MFTTFKIFSSYQLTKWIVHSHSSSPYTSRLWEAFYGDGTSGYHLAALGFDVIHEDLDFFTHDLGECVVTKPPFSELPRVLARLRELDKPFVVIMPCSKLMMRSKTSR